MDIKDLNRSQLILLALLLSFVTSLATGITTVTLMEQAPDSVTVPITKIVRQTVEKIVPSTESLSGSPLSDEEKELLKELKSFQSSSAVLVLKKDNQEEIVARGFYIGNDIAVVGKEIEEAKNDEEYYIKSNLGVQKVNSIKNEDTYSILKLSSKIEDSIEENEAVPPVQNQEEEPTQENQEDIIAKPVEQY